MVEKYEAPHIRMMRERSKLMAILYEEQTLVVQGPFYPSLRDVFLSQRLDDGLQTTYGISFISEITRSIILVPFRDL